MRSDKTIEWSMRPSILSSGGVNVRASMSMQDDDNLLFVFRGQRRAVVSENAWWNLDDDCDWLQIQFDDGVIGYVAKEFVTVVPENLPDGVSNQSLEDIVMRWLVANVNISDDDGRSVWVDHA